MISANEEYVIAIFFVIVGYARPMRFDVERRRLTMESWQHSFMTTSYISTLTRSLDFFGRGGNPFQRDLHFFFAFIYELKTSFASTKEMEMIHFEVAAFDSKY